MKVGRPKTGVNTISKNYSLDKDTVRDLEKYAKNNHLSKSMVIKLAIKKLTEVD